MRRIKFAEGEFYHLYNRGVDKRIVFTAANEYERFLAYLYLMNDRKTQDYAYLLHANSGGLASLIQEAKPSEERTPLVAIGAYCLMPNHFHLYVTQLTEGGISKFMQRLQTAYTMYFNDKHERSGALFQGTFKAKHMERDAQTKYLLSYIHLNPAKIKDPTWKDLGPRDLKRLGDFVRQYPYSSLVEYLTSKRVITDVSEFPAYLSNLKELDEHIDWWLRFREQGLGG